MFDSRGSDIPEEKDSYFNRFIAYEYYEHVNLYKLEEVKPLSKLHKNANKDCGNSDNYIVDNDK
eukprot:2943010-Ditylum_brightwellii.AAC.1